MERPKRDLVDEVSGLAARRGFFWNAYEIYGGVSGFLTWGPLGAALKRKIADLWRKTFVLKHGFIEIDAPLVTPYPVFEASGHVEGFKDTMVACLKCSQRFKADELLSKAGARHVETLSPSQVDSQIHRLGVTCPECDGTLGKASLFTTMFQTTIGPLGDSVGFLRPETAQGMFTEFKRAYSVERKKMPLGIAQVGRVFRNEISPRQGPIRLREIDFMEVELFYDPERPECPFLGEVRDVKMNLVPESVLLKGGEEMLEVSVGSALDEGFVKSEWLGYFMGLAQGFMSLLGIPPSRQRFREHLEGERAHYSKQTFDQEVLLSRWGWVEVSGHAHRTDFDLSAHMSKTGEDLTAERVLRKAVRKSHRRVRPKAELIKELVGDDIGAVMRELNSWPQEQTLGELDDKGHVYVAGYRLKRQLFRIETIEKKTQIERFIPYVAEPSFGLERVAYSTLEYGFKSKEGRVVLALPPQVAPVEAAVFPIVSRKPLEEMAGRIHSELLEKGIRATLESKETIGRRYARADEVGVPVCITVDRQSLKDETVTARDRDSWEQLRIPAASCTEFVQKVLGSESFGEAAQGMAT